jgi:hypothetical protein
MHGIRGRFVGALLSLTTFGFGLGVADTAAAQTSSAQVCHDALADIAESRQTLEELEFAVGRAKANRATLLHAASEIAAQIAAAGSLAEIEALKADRRAVLEEVRTIDSLLPPIETQAKALAAQVAEAERGYIACIEASIAN